jgi:hypothetical protein
MHVKRHTRLVVILAALSLTVPIPAAVPHASAQVGTSAGQPVPDTRERVRLAAAERDTIRLEMRTMLQGLSEILQGLVAGDLVKVEKAARGSGAATALDASFEKKLPPDFFQLGVRTHKRFDALADVIKTGSARDVVLRRLAAITASCVTCHDRYRFEERRE